MRKLPDFIEENTLDIIIFMMILALLVFIFPITLFQRNNESLNSYLLQFSSIFSAIVITVIISKIFSQRQENSKRKEEIVKLSNKVSDLRRISKILIDNDIWPSGIKSILNNDYANLTYEILEDQNLPIDTKEYDLQNKYINDSRFNKIIGNLYISLKSIKGRDTDHGLFLYNKYDFDYTYEFEEVNNWVLYHAANTLWYTFDYKYELVNNKLNLNNLRRESQNEILHLATKIDSTKYSSYTTLTNKLLANIGTDFDSFYLERLRYLLYENRPVLPISVKFSLNIMIVIMVFGAIFPFCYQIADIHNPFLIKLNFSIFLASIIFFLLKFKEYLIKELKV